MDDQQMQGRRLGRGLNALLGVGVSTLEEGPASVDHSEIHIELIERNPFQPRQDFEPEALNELVESIRQHGVLQPLLVRAIGDRYQLIAGERRLIAARRAGLNEVPCRALDLTDQQVSEVALEENLKRQDLNVLEKAIAFQEYLQRFQCSIDELARRLSFDRSTVSNMLRLLELPDAIKTDLRSGKISAGHARALLPLDEVTQHSLCQKIINEGLSVRKTEEAARQIISSSASDTLPFPGVAGGTGPKPADGAGFSGMSNHIASMQEQIRDWLGAAVEIKLRGKNAGKIVIEFKTNEDFERIIGQLQKAA